MSEPIETVACYEAAGIIPQTRWWSRSKQALRLGREQFRGGDLDRAGLNLVKIALILGIVLPLAPLVIWAFSFSWFYPDLFPPRFSLRAWAYVLSPASRTAEAALTSGGVALLVTLVSVGIGLPAGRALGLYNFRGKKIVQFLILAPVIVPGLAVVMGIHVVFIRLGLAGTWLGVALVHLIAALPYVVMVMSSVFANYQPELEEQARTLGAGPIAVFLYVTCPAIWPGLVVAGMFAFIISWEQYLVTLLVGGGQVITLPLLLVNFATGNNNPVTAALSLVFVAPSLVLLGLTSKYLGGEKAMLGGFRA